MENTKMGGASDPQSSDPSGVEWLRHGSDVEALIVRAQHDVRDTTFLTGGTAPFQLGLIAYPRAGAVVPHIHLPVERQLLGTSEVLLLRRGLAEVDFYDAARRVVFTRRLFPGDMLLILSGGHGIRFLEDSLFLEVKQGPYAGVRDKERFDIGPVAGESTK